VKKLTMQTDLYWW